MMLSDGYSLGAAENGKEQQNEIHSEEMKRRRDVVVKKRERRKPHKSNT